MDLTHKIKEIDYNWYVKYSNKNNTSNDVDFNFVSDNFFKSG